MKIVRHPGVVPHHHFLVYYKDLDHAATSNVTQCLYSDWRNFLEQPILWLDDLHLYLYTNILWSLLEEGDSDEYETTWKSPSKADERSSNFTWSSWWSIKVVLAMQIQLQLMMIKTRQLQQIELIQKMIVVQLVVRINWLKLACMSSMAMRTGTQCQVSEASRY